MPKTILITGCSSGIGLCAAKVLHNLGYHVLATARKKKDVINLKKQGLDSFLLDISSSKSINNSVKEIFKRTPYLYAIFHNAGFAIPGALEDLSRKAFREQFETNVFGTAELTAKLLPLMRKQGYGRIIINSSILGFVSMPFRGAYNSSKYALEGFADTLRLELPNNIYVSLIEPGPITSKFRENAYKNFLRYINPGKSDYRKEYSTLVKRFKTKDTETPFNLPPGAVVKKLIKALESKKPKARYYVTFPTYLFAYLKRLLPANFLDFLLRKVN